MGLTSRSRMCADIKSLLLPFERPVNALFLSSFVTWLVL